MEWTEGDLAFRELIRQPYSNCVFSAGAVDGHPVDTLYLKLERDGRVDTFLLLRPDEVTALLWCLSGVLWASQVENVNKGVSGMPEQVPSIGRIVHFVYGGVHVPAIITDPAFVVRVAGEPDWGGQALTVFLPAAPPFTTVAVHQDEIAPGTWTNATWHWPEYVPAKDA